MVGEKIEIQDLKVGDEILYASQGQFIRGVVMKLGNPRNSKWGSSFTNFKILANVEIVEKKNINPWSKKEYFTKIKTYHLDEINEQTEHLNLVYKSFYYPLWLLRRDNPIIHTYKKRK